MKTKTVNRDLIISLDKALKLVLNQAGVRRSQIPKKVVYKEVKGEFEAMLPDYAEYVDGGRKAGKMPPVKDIVAWMKQKKIKAPKGTRRIDIAWAIARSIGEDGIKPRPFIDKFQEQVGDLLLKQLDTQIDNILKEKK